MNNITITKDDLWELINKCSIDPDSDIEDDWKNRGVEWDGLVSIGRVMIRAALTDIAQRGSVSVEYEMFCLFTMAFELGFIVSTEQEMRRIHLERTD
jgi:hypothetical protein